MTPDLRRLHTANTYYLTVSEGREFERGLAGVALGQGLLGGCCGLKTGWRTYFQGDTLAQLWTRGSCSLLAVVGGRP